ncbi:hypothetical protein HDU76_012378 [Blyttiomyces sp. JEL0837]|nr:hypothetical protein HDU76_012378 [Blyttiomyces sp. JEL0837]
MIFDVVKNLSMSDDVGCGDAVGSSGNAVDIDAATSCRPLLPPEFRCCIDSVRCCLRMGDAVTGSTARMRTMASIASISLEG